MQFRTIKVRVRFVVERDEEGFHAFCPDLKGLHVGGSDEEEALKNARDAAIAYLQSLIKHDQPIPIGVLQSDETKTAGQLARECLHRIFGPQPRSHVEELQLAT